MPPRDFVLVHVPFLTRPVSEQTGTENRGIRDESRFYFAAEGREGS